MNISLYKNIGYLTLTSVITSILNLVAVIIFTRYVSMDVFGQYRYILSIIGILSLLTLPGLNISLINSIANKYEGSFLSVTKKRIKYSLIGSGIFLILAGWHFFIKKEIDIATVLVALSIIFLGYSSLDHVYNFFVGRQEYRNVMLSRTVKAVLYFGLVLISVLLTDNIIIISLFVFGGISIYHLILSVYIIKNLRNSYTNKKYVDFGMKISGLNVIGTINSWLDSLIVGFFWGYAELALYSIGKVIHTFLKEGWGIFQQIAQPTFAKKDFLEAYRISNKKLKIIWPSTFIILGLVYFILPTVIPVIFSNAYGESVFYAQLFLIPTMLAIPAFFYEVIMRSHQMTHELYVTRIASSILSLVVLIIAGYYIGVVGIIISRIINAGSLSLIGFLLLSRKLKE